VFKRSARLYDLFYDWKDYEEEARRLRELIAGACPHARSLLDVACGTGRHLEYLRRHYDAEGLDLNAELLEIAAERNPETPFHQADMVNFSLPRDFDVVTCLFSSIGYVNGLEGMHQAISNMAKHVRAGGVLILEPWFGPDDWEDGHVSALYVDQPRMKAARMNVSRSEGRFSVLDFHYLAAESSGVSYFTEKHSLFLFTHDEYSDALSQAGLEIHFDRYGLEGRGLYIGRRV
jgi:SAM-dependent methyltransferase